MRNAYVVNRKEYLMINNCLFKRKEKKITKNNRSLKKTEENTIHGTYLAYLRETLLTNSRIFIAALGLLIIVLVFVFSSFQVQGKAETEYKYYKSVEVHSGDTLWTIAQTYMNDDYASVQEYIDEVQKINGISGENITAGHCVVVPYYSKELH